MKRLVSIMLVLTMLFSQAFADDLGSAVLSFDANETTGYSWFAFVLGGDSVVIDESASGYVSDPNHDMLDGVGGTYYAKLDAVRPGKSIVRFSYMRSWEEGAVENVIILADVADDLSIQVCDVTESGVYEGTVTAVDARTQTASINIADEEITAVFDRDAELPAEGDAIAVYTDGTMTYSLPPKISVIAWETLTDENEFEDTDEDDILTMVIDYTAAALQELVCDDSYVSLFTSGMDLEDELAAYKQIRGEEPVSCYEIDALTFLQLYYGYAMEDLTDVGSYMLDQQLNSASTIVNFIASRSGSMALVASTIVRWCEVCDYDLPSSAYMLEYANGVGIIVSIWNNGYGFNMITAGFIPDVSMVTGDEELAILIK